MFLPYAEPSQEKTWATKKQRKDRRGDRKHVEMKCEKSKPHAYLIRKPADGAVPPLGKLGHHICLNHKHICEAST